MNAINYLNLLYLSDNLNQCRQTAERDELLGAILQTNTYTFVFTNAARAAQGTMSIYRANTIFRKNMRRRCYLI